MVLFVHIDKKLGSPGDLGGMEPGADATVPAAKRLHSGPGEAVSKETVSMVPDAAAPADNGVAVATTEDEVQAGPSEPSAANTRTNLKYTTEDSMATIRSAANSPPARGLLAVATDDGLWVAEDVSDMVKADKGKGKAVEVVPTVEAGRTLVAAGDEQDEVEVDWTAYDAPEALLDLFGNESERVRTIIVRSVENVRTRIRAAREAQRTADGQDDEAKGKSLDHSANANGGESSVASASPSASPRASASTAGPSGAPAAVAAGPAKSSSPSLAGGEAEGAPVMPYMTSATPPSSPRPQKPSEKRSRFGFKNLFHRSHQRGESSSSGAASAIVRIAAEITTATRVDVGYYSGPSSHQASTPNVHKKRMSKGKGIALPKPLSRPASILSSKSMATSDTAPDAKPQVPPKDNEE